MTTSQLWFYDGSDEFVTIALVWLSKAYGQKTLTDIVTPVALW